MAVDTTRPSVCCVRFARCLVLTSFFLVNVAAAYAGEVTLAWDPIPAPNVAGYFVYVGTSAQTADTPVDVGAATTFKYTNAAPGVTYYFAVAGYATDGTVGARSAVISGTALAPPAAPVLVSPKNTTTTTSPAFSWNAVAGASSYLLSVSDTTQTGKILRDFTPAQASCTTAGSTCSVTAPVPLAAGAANWSVRATNRAGEGPWAASAAFTVGTSAAHTPPLPVTPVAANGSFEQGFEGWTVAGAADVVSGGFWQASHGTKAVAFNGGQRAPNGSVARTFATTKGATYTVTFDVGAISGVNRDEQRLQVTAQGKATAPLVSQVASVKAPGNGTTYASQRVTFVADGDTATLTFRDVSAVTMNVDLMLDNIVITSSSGSTPTPETPATPTPVPAFTNGSFESGTTDWTVSGNLEVVSGAPWQAADGAKAVVFNAGQRTPNGALTRTIATVSGRTYAIDLAVGAISGLNTDEQRVQVMAQAPGGATLLSQVAAVKAPGNGTRYASHRFTFVASGTSTTLTFRDVSLSTMNVDLMLDHIRVSAVN